MELLGQRLFAFDRRQGDLRLEGRPMIASRYFRRLAPLIRHYPVALVKPGYHLAYCPNFRSPSVFRAGVWLPVEHCYAHALHQLAHMYPAHVEPSRFS